jgi:uncharacterized phage protein (TIGR02218 family)
MKTASPALVALLASNQYLYADLFTISLVGGGTLYYTNADGGLNYGGNYYACTSPRIQRSGAKTAIGVQVDTLTIQIFGGASELIQGVPFPQFAVNGGFDGAEISVDRCYMNTFGDTSAGTLNVFFGDVTEVKPSRTAVELTVSSKLELLNISMPRNLISPGCIHNLFDAGCTLAKASFAAAGTVATGSSTNVIETASLAQAAGYFTFGTITFNSGINAGVSATIKAHVLTSGTATLTLMAPLQSPPAAGDTFMVYPGCDKSMATCSATFNNLLNFRGWPFVPSPTASM